RVEDRPIGTWPTGACARWLRPCSRRVEWQCADEPISTSQDHALTPLVTSIVHGGPHRGALPQADFLFFLSSSTSVNSASTTSSFLPEASASAPAPACLYIASPSFMEACASALVLAVIASASEPLRDSLRSAIASSIARLSVSPTFEPCSASALSLECTSASAWFLASTSALRFL